MSRQRLGSPQVWKPQGWNRAWQAPGIGPKLHPSPSAPATAPRNSVGCEALPRHAARGPGSPVLDVAHEDARLLPGAPKVGDGR